MFMRGFVPYVPLRRLAVAVVLLCISTSNGGDDVLKDIVGAWESRSANTQSFSFAWEGTQYDARGKDVPEGGDSRGLGDPVRKGPLPSEGTTFTYKMSFIVDSKWGVRRDYDGKAYSVSKNAYLPQVSQFVTSKDGTTTLANSQSGVGFPYVSINDAKAIHVGAIHMDLIPLKNFYRALDSTFQAFARSQLVLTPDKAVVDGVACVIVRYPDGTLWIDPSKEWAIVREQYSPGGRLSRSVEVSYATDVETGWYPSNWKITQYSPEGDVTSSMDATVTQHATNIAVPGDTFQPQLPPNAWVRNTRTGENYILRGNGSRRKIYDGEYDRYNYEEIVNSEPGALLTTPDEGGAGVFHTWLFVAGATFVGALIACLVWMRRR